MSAIIKGVLFTLWVVAIAILLMFLAVNIERDASSDKELLELKIQLSKLEIEKLKGLCE